MSLLKKRFKDGLFKGLKYLKLYICFEPLHKGFSAGYKRFDGTFINHHVGGILLTTIGQAGNDGMYPIAWTLVKGENSASRS